MNPYLKTATKSPLLVHAEDELRRLGMYDGDQMNESMAADVLDVLKVVTAQGHSGFSIHYLIDLVSKLALFEPLTPLQGTDDEWIDITPTMGDDGKRHWQNKRAPSVFKTLDTATGTVSTYDVEGRVFEEPNGTRYKSSDSKVPVTFPYTPTTEVVKVPKSARTASFRRLPDGHRGWFA